jgi:hypothetical protein
MSRSSRGQVRAAREACRQEANGRGLSGAERIRHLRNCLAAKAPTFAKRTACRKQGKTKGLSQAGLRDYIRQCMAGKG